MWSEIIKTIILAMFAIATTIGGVWDKLIKKPIIIDSIKSSKKREESEKTNIETLRNKIVALSLILGVFITQAFQISDKREDLKKIAEKTRMQKDSDVFLKSGLYDIDEASGGTIYGDLAYIVDDDSPLIFPMRYGKNSEKPNEYDFEFSFHGIPICDARNNNDDNNKADYMKKGEEFCSDGTSKIVDGDVIEDLEGAASYRERLYLVTSHSNSPRKGKPQPRRQLFLEIELQKNDNGNIIAAKITNSTKILRDKIKEQFKNGIQGHNFEEFEQIGRYDLAKKKTLEVMNIEGLAIDSEGNVYFGFRNPVIDGHALVLRTDMNQVFSDNPKFESFLLMLGGYGIVSLDYKDNKIYILGNSPDRYILEDFKIWEWLPGVSQTQELKSYTTKDLFTKLSQEGIISRPAKPEVFLVPNDETFHLFFDADGTGGQLPLFRKDKDLSREAFQQ